MDPKSLKESQIIGEIRKQVRKLAPALKGYKIVLFGSRASQQAGERSDFDIGIVGKRPLPSTTFFALEELINEIPTLFKIDLVDFQNTSVSFRKEALRSTQLLYPHG